MIYSSTFSMQGRMVMALSASGGPVLATQFQAFVMQALAPFNSSAVQVEINGDRTGRF